MEFSLSGLLKRMLDLVLTVAALLVLWPVLLVVWILVRCRFGKPAIFRQIRAGWHEQPFTLYKFRTMTQERGDDGELLTDAQRLTPLGRLLRKASLDELPELLNVLKGDMSLVGPRPLYVSYLPWYSERERLRHTIKPGLTGWAQIHGRNYLPWDERLALDAWYVENRSLWIDLRILAQTAVKIITREGTSADTHAVEGNLEQIRRSQKTTCSSKEQGK
jgi:sugar transferase EpsL